MGLATCPLEGFSADAMQKEFGIPKNYIPVMLIMLGFSDEKKPPRERLWRKGFEEMVHMEGYKVKSL